jgi:hypothetical protein
MLHLRMARNPEPTFYALTHSALVLAGLLLLGVGIGNTIAGRSKLMQYDKALRAAPVAVPRDPATLFPKPSDGEERREAALAKLAFYELLLTFGQVLSAAGFALIAAGVLRILRPPRAASIDFRTPGV